MDMFVAVFFLLLQMMVGYIYTTAEYVFGSLISNTLPRDMKFDVVCCCASSWAFALLVGVVVTRSDEVVIRLQVDCSIFRRRLIDSHFSSSFSL